MGQQGEAGSGRGAEMDDSARRSAIWNEGAPSQNWGIDGLRVLVTAGAGGIGSTIVERLIELGARVFICDIAETALQAFARAHGNANWIKADVASETDVDRMFDAVHDRLGGLDALINNAGVAGPTGAIEDIDPADWRRCLDVCLTGQFLCARRAVPMLKASRGSLVNISSAAGRHGYPFRTPYSSAKFGVIGLTQSLAKELGPAGVRVNAILPGIVEGERMEGVMRARACQQQLTYEETKVRYLERISLRRMVEADDVASMALFLLSNWGRNVSGQSIGVDGNIESL